MKPVVDPINLTIGGRETGGHPNLHSNQHKFETSEGSNECFLDPG